MESKISLEIECPIESVFRITNEQVAEWSLIVVANNVLDEGQRGLGARFQTITEDQGVRLVFDGVVTCYEPPFKCAVRLTGKMFDIETEYHFEEAFGKTRATQMSQLRGKGFFQVYTFLFGWFMKRGWLGNARKELESLKRFCEQKAG